MTTNRYIAILFLSLSTLAGCHHRRVIFNHNHPRTAATQGDPLSDPAPKVVSASVVCDGGTILPGGRNVALNGGRIVVRIDRCVPYEVQQERAKEDAEWRKQHGHR